jgi:hypothetical protein
LNFSIKSCWLNFHCYKLIIECVVHGRVYDYHILFFFKFWKLKDLLRWSRLILRCSISVGTWGHITWNFQFLNFQKILEKIKKKKNFSSLNIKLYKTATSTKRTLFKFWFSKKKNYASFNHIHCNTTLFMFILLSLLSVTPMCHIK